MVRHFTFITTVLVVMGLLTHIDAKAQGQDQHHLWNGNPLHTIVDKGDTDMGTVYLYNVGTGKFLNTGSYWGTAVVGFNVGMTTHVLRTSKQNTYKMTGPLVTTEGKYVAFGRQMDTPGPENQINYNRVYVDRGVDWTDDFTHTTHKNGILEWKIERTNDGNSNTYYIHCHNDETWAGMGGELYLSMAHVGTGKTYDIQYPHTPDGNYSKWKFVTKKDLKNAFKDTYASDEAPSDATFLVYDQNFERGNIYVEHWKASGGLKWAYVEKTNAQGQTYTVPYIFKPDSKDCTYYVGNGAISSNYYMAQYAGYTTANVRNVGNDDNANGKITQSVKTIKRGWYKVTCNGFYNRDNGSSMVSKLFAKVQGSNATISNVSTELDRFNDDFSYSKEDLLKVYDASNLPSGSAPKVSPYVNAGMLFEKGKYNNTVLVYVPSNNSTLDIGIEISNSTEDRDWTCWDNVQLQYCGSNDLVLDEGQKNINYIQLQVSPNTAGTLILKRTMKLGTWCSIMLPVNLTAGQVKTAFGENVKLSCLPKQHDTIKTRIEFKSVDLSNDDNMAIEANKLYIIKPDKVPTGKEQEDPYKKQLKDNSYIEVSAPYYVINNVSLKQDPSTFAGYDNGIIKEASTPSTTIDEKLQFCGSLINQTNKVVPAYSYALGTNDGKWHFTQHDLPVKGFRCWIATGSQALAKTLRFFIDGVEEDTATAIDGVVNEEGNEVSGTVYDLNGKVVRTNATSLEGLPKGIYIVNHRKYVVR
ncbi:adhesin [Prevotella denticola]|uniref:adhesin n=1 Tax=Prevotella denticola TaxID=28129 RepID=UPI001BC86192|nr:adhesin [Prevotella denticola]QUI94317.1 adhesin [Prevotella denticola]